MNRGEKVLSLAKKIVKELRPFCKRIEIAGSIRRKKPNPGDIDIVLVAKNETNKEKIKEKLSENGKFLEGGDKKMFFKINGINVQLFFAISEEWGATLLAYSGEKGANIGLRIVAEKQGFKLTSHGLFRNSNGKKVAGKTEREIYKALGRPYKEPWNR
jgi:DNA polymerase (family 10)